MERAGASMRYLENTLIAMTLLLASIGYNLPSNMLLAQ
jgi:hypothetical protein